MIWHLLACVAATLTIGFSVGYAAATHNLFEIAKGVISREDHANIFGYPYDGREWDMHDA